MKIRHWGETWQCRWFTLTAGTKLINYECFHINMIINNVPSKACPSVILVTLNNEAPQIIKRQTLNIYMSNSFRDNPSIYRIFTHKAQCESPFFNILRCLAQLILNEILWPLSNLSFHILQLELNLKNMYIVNLVLHLTELNQPQKWNFPLFKHQFHIDLWRYIYRKTVWIVNVQGHLLIYHKHCCVCDKRKQLFCADKSM